MHDFLDCLNQEKIVFLLFVVIFAGFSATLPGFLNANNLVLLLQGISVLGILGVGLCVVVLGRGIDLSMVATMALSVAWALQLNIDGMNLYLALSLGLGAAVIVGGTRPFLAGYFGTFASKRSGLRSSY